MADWRKIAENEDINDPLSGFRDRFRRSDEKLIYLDGNSLGMMPVKTREILEDTITLQWGDSLVGGWNIGWWEMPSVTGRLISTIIGAGEEEVIVCDSTSVNLYKLLFAALKMRPGRKKIVSDELNFPSDLYIMQGVAANSSEGHYIELARSDDGIGVSDQALESVIDDNTAVVVLTHVCFKSGFMYDIGRITDLAHQKGALIIWDLCHSVGAVEIGLNRAGADMAVGCTYKYLNGGPGSPSFLYARKDIQDSLQSPVWGWLGESDPFKFSPEFSPAKGVGKFLAGTPGILSMSAIKPALEITLEAGIEALRGKSVAMTSFFLEMASEKLFPIGVTPGSPADPARRGSHISLRHPEGYRISKALIDPFRGEFRIIPDFRPPDNIRFGFAPLYNSFIEIYNTVNQLEWIIRERIYEEYDYDTGCVT